MNRACPESFTALTTYSIAVPQNSIDQLLIRHNQKGSVRLVRSNVSDSVLQLNVAWHTRSQTEFDRHYMVFGKINGELNSFLLQVGLVPEPDSSLLQWVLLAALGLVSAFIAGVLVFWYVKRKRWQKLEAARRKPGGPIEMPTVQTQVSEVRPAVTVTSDADRLVHLRGAFLQHSDSKSTNMTELVGSPIRHCMASSSAPGPAVGAGTSSGPAAARIFATSLSDHSLCKDAQSGASTRSRESGSLKSSSSGRFVLISAIIFAVLAIAHATEVWPMLGCLEIPSIDVTIHVPQNVEIESIQAFFQREFQRQTSLVAIGYDDDAKLPSLAAFDVRSAARLADGRCSANSFCPLAAQQGLVGCDPAEQCVCRRGFEMVDGICIDVNECIQQPRPCSINAACENTIGSFRCICDEGFLGDGRICTQIELDSLRRPCDVCGESAYDARGCVQPNRTYCIPIEYGSAVDQTGLLSPALRNPLQVRNLVTRASDNVFIENLLEVQEQSQKVYVTNNNNNAHEFILTRPSNLSISVKVFDMQLVPEVNDQEYESDNAFMLGRKGSPTPEQMVFDRIVKSHCRNPMPDYYSLTLEFYRDRTTSMQEELCDSSNPARKVCPEPLIDGVDSIRYRSLNEPCPIIVMNSSKVSKPSKKSRLVPQRLFEDSNSILCMDNVPLLTDLFKRPLSPEKFELPPNRLAECKIAEASCEQCESSGQREDACFSGASAQNASAPSRICTFCSKKQCYAQTECRRSMQPSCVEVLPVCARGDVARITLQPVFANIRSEFRCPVRFVRAQRLNNSDLVPLFRIEYSVNIPQLAFSTNKTQDVVTTRLASTALLSEAGSARVGLFDVNYRLNMNSLAKLDDSVDFVLVGKLQNDSRYHLQLDRIKSAAKWSRQHVIVADNRWLVAAIQPRQPFRISTSTWMKNYQNCHQSIDEFYAHQDMFDVAESNAINANDLRVEQVRRLVENSAEDYDASATDANGGPFGYAVTSKTAFPSVTFRLPAKQSALAQYFANQDNILQTDERNLRTSLRLDAHTSVFNFSVHGRVRRCGLLQLTLAEFYSRTSVLQLDVLINCPPAAPHAPQPFTVSSSFQLSSADQLRSVKRQAADIDNSLDPPSVKYVFELRITDQVITHVVKMVYDEPVQRMLTDADYNNGFSINSIDAAGSGSITNGDGNGNGNNNNNNNHTRSTLSRIDSEPPRFTSSSTPASSTRSVLQETLQRWALSSNLMTLAVVLVSAYLLLIAAHCFYRIYAHYSIVASVAYPTVVRPAIFPITTPSVLHDAQPNSLTVLTTYSYTGCGRAHAVSTADTEHIGLTSNAGNGASDSNRGRNRSSSRSAARSKRSRGGRRGTSVCFLTLVVITRIVHHAVFNVSVFLTLALYINQSQLQQVETLLFNASDAQTQSATVRAGAMPVQSLTQELKTRRMGELESEFANLAQVSGICNTRLSRLAEDLRFQAENVADYHLSQLFKVDYNSAQASLSVLSVLENRVVRQLAAHRAQLDAYMAHYKNSVLPTQLGKQYAVLNKLLFKVYNSAWLQFARYIFNETSSSRKSPSAHSVLAALYDANDTTQLKSLLFKREYVEFANFLNVAETEQLAFVPLQLVKAFESKRPRYEQAGFIRAEQVNEIVNTVILAEDVSRKQASALPFSVKLPAGLPPASAGVANAPPAAPADSLAAFDIKDYFVVIRIALLAFDLLLFASRLLFTFNFARALWTGVPIVRARLDLDITSDLDLDSAALSGMCDSSNAHAPAAAQRQPFNILAYLRSKPTQCLAGSKQAASGGKNDTGRAPAARPPPTSSFASMVGIFVAVWCTHVTVKRALVLGICLCVACAFETVSTGDQRGLTETSDVVTLRATDRTLSSFVRRQVSHLDAAIDSVLLYREKIKVRRKVERMKQFTNQFNYDQWRTLHTHQAVSCGLAYASSQSNSSTSAIYRDCLRSAVHKQQLLSTDYLGGCTFVPNRPRLTRGLLDSALGGRSAAANRELAAGSIQQVVRSLVFLFILTVTISELYCNYFCQLLLDVAVLRMHADGTCREISCSAYPPADRVIRDGMTLDERDKSVVHQQQSLMAQQTPQLDFGNLRGQIWESENLIAGDKHESRV